MGPRRDPQARRGCRPAIARCRHAHRTARVGPRPPARGPSRLPPLPAGTAPQRLSVGQVGPTQARVRRIPLGAWPGASRGRVVHHCGRPCASRGDRRKQAVRRARGRSLKQAARRRRGERLACTGHQLREGRRGRRRLRLGREGPVQFHHRQMRGVEQHLGPEVAAGGSDLEVHGWLGTQLDITAPCARKRPEALMAWPGATSCAGSHRGCSRHPCRSPAGSAAPLSRELASLARGRGAVEGETRGRLDRHAAADILTACTQFSF